MLSVNYLCPGLKHFFAHTQPHLEHMSLELDPGTEGVQRM